MSKPWSPELRADQPAPKRRGCLWLALAFLGVFAIVVAASSIQSHQEEAAKQAQRYPIDITNFTDQSAGNYQIDSVTAESDETGGTVHLTVRWEADYDSNREPLLQAVVHYTGDLSFLTATCENDRPHIRSTAEGPDTLDLYCGSSLPQGSATVLIKKQ